MQRRRRRILIALATMLLAAAVALAPAPVGAASSDTKGATSPLPNFVTREVEPHEFVSPIWVGSAGDGINRLYVAEQRGIVWQLDGATKRRWLDLRRVVTQSGGEQGLLSIAFAADFRTSGRVYAYFVLPNGAGQVRQYRTRRTADGPVVIANSGRVIITVPLSPPSETNHNGGNLWSRSDGTLYLSVGDGGGAGDPSGNSQRLDRLTGKILRIAPKLSGGYIVPRTNPFVNRRGARKEVWALGLRNPWRFSIDGATGNMWIGDVGQGNWEEIDVLRGGRPFGANFGWNRFEGSMVYDRGTNLTAGTTYVGPRIRYNHSTGRCSVTGGVVYRGPHAALRGWYLYADWCEDEIYAFLDNGARTVSRVAVPGIVHFGAGPDGRVFVASQSQGKIYEVTAP